MDERGLVRFLFQKKPALTLAHLAARGRSYTSVIARDTQTTFAHSTYIFNMLQRYGLVRILRGERDKRIKYAVLTAQGEFVAERIIELLVFAEHSRHSQDTTISAQRVSRRINGIIRQLKSIEDNNKAGIPCIVGPLRWNLSQLKQSESGLIKRLVEEIDERIMHHLHKSSVQEESGGRK